MGLAIGEQKVVGIAGFVAPSGVLKGLLEAQKTICLMDFYEEMPTVGFYLSTCSGLFREKNQKKKRIVKRRRSRIDANTHGSISISSAEP